MQANAHKLPAIKNISTFMIFDDLQAEENDCSVTDAAPDDHRPPSPFLIIADKLVSGPVILNVGGKKYETTSLLIKHIN